MSSISLSFTPGEIITPGTTLQLNARRAVKPDSAQAAVHLFHAGRIVPTTVSVQTTTVNVSTDNLVPATYQVAINGLLDTNNQPLSDPMVVPIVVGALRGRVPKEFRVEHALHLAVDDLSTTRLRPGEPEPSGTRYLEVVKAVHTQTGVPNTFSFDGQGKAVDGLQLLVDVEQRRAAKFGRIHEKLWNHLQKTSSNELVNIAVWPVMGPHVHYDKPNDHEVTERPVEERVALGQLKEKKSKVIDALKRLNATLPDAPYEVPVVAASLTAANVRQLAQSNDVGLVFLDDHKGINDLKNSMAIAHSDRAQALGFTGTGVKVAVFEDGPTNTNDLVYAARYQNNPPASDHARLTSAVIKNIEPNKPHGHAPNCDLYSANSFSNDALSWAVGQGCTVISQSFHRDEEQTTGTLSSDDILKDYYAIHYPFPTIVQAAGNGDSSEYVNHKGYNSISVGNHDDNAAVMSADSVFRNPISLHSDRELPELAANGTEVTAVGETMSGTSFAAPAVAGITALLQSVDSLLKSWPEGCRAILLASAGRNITGSTWWDDVASRKDASDGSGAADAEAGVKIAQHRAIRGAAASMRGWDVGTLASTDFGTDKLSTFRYHVQVPNTAGLVVKAALAWDSVLSADKTTSTLTLDHDLLIYDSQGALVAFSSSFDNSYEIVEFVGVAGKTYDIVIRRWSGMDAVWYGVAWTVFQGGQTLPFRAALTVQA